MTHAFRTPDLPNDPPPRPYAVVLALISANVAAQDQVLATGGDRTTLMDEQRRLFRERDLAKYAAKGVKPQRTGTWNS